ncbi:MAG: hypothetical protein QOH63_1581 [Acidobacteriota bacterium]|nr:hypothetical protein [Acidobacteriota bacterium]
MRDSTQARVARSSQSPACFPLRTTDIQSEIAAQEQIDAKRKSFARQAANIKVSEPKMCLDKLARRNSDRDSYSLSLLLRFRL